VAARCRERGAAVETKVLDVCEVAAMADWIVAAGQLDIVIANAQAQAASAARGVSVVNGLTARTTELFAAACDGGALAALGSAAASVWFHVAVSALRLATILRIRSAAPVATSIAKLRAALIGGLILLLLGTPLRHPRSCGGAGVANPLGILLRFCRREVFQISRTGLR